MSTRVDASVRMQICELMGTHMFGYASSHGLVHFEPRGREVSAERANIGAISSRVSEMAEYPASFMRRDDVGFLVFSQRKQMPCVAGHEVFGVAGLGHG